MLPKSDSLFHFTKSLDFLQGILSVGFQPRYSLEDTALVGIEYTAYPMVCFCDIPISRISEHSAFYGEYGIGMTKEWGRKNGLQPLLYGVPGGQLAKAANALDELGDRQPNDTPEVVELRGKITDCFFDLLPMIKPINGKMIISGEVIEKDFLQENEWRFVPNEYALLFRDKLDAERATRNEEMIGHSLRFSPADVRHLFVKLDHEIPSLFDFIHRHLGHFPMNDVKILTTRISSLETLAKDL